MRGIKVLKKLVDDSWKEESDATLWIFFKKNHSLFEILFLLNDLLSSANFFVSLTFTIPLTHKLFSFAVSPVPI